MSKFFHLRRPTSNRHSNTKRHQRLFPRLESLEHRLLLSITDVTTGTMYPTIQAAVNGANPGDTILVGAGSYAEKVTVNKSLILEGAQHGIDAQTRSGAETVVTGIDDGTGHITTPFDITANNVTLDGFTVEGATSSTEFGFGILEGAGTSGTQILNNIVQNNIAGLSLSNATGGNSGLIQHNLFQNNNVTGPVSGTAIYTDQFNAGGSLANVTIDGNSFLNDTNSGVIIGPTDATKGASNVTISNNTFNGDGNAVLLFNTSSSSVTDNTMTNSTGSQLVIGGGVNGLKVTNNLIQNGATRGIRIGDFGGGSTNQNVTINYNNIQGNGTAGLEIDSAAGAYTGTLDASKNWWGDISGPTIATNSGGSGQKINDPNGQVNYRPWLIYGTDADLTKPGFQLPTTVPVTSHGDTSAAVNDFTILQNAIGAAAAGQTIDLSGTFDWTKTNAAAAFAASTNTAPSGDIRGVALPDGVNNLTITSSAQNAKIIGVGDSTDAAFNAFLFSAVDGSSPTDVGNNNLTVSNLNIDNFESGVFLGWNSTGTFNGTLVKNNTITVAGDSDNNQVNGFQSIAVYFTAGQNQTMTGNTIDFMGNGTRTAGNGAFSYGFQDSTNGGTGYNGLSIDHNVFQLLPSAVGGTETVTGIWENGHNDDNASHIQIVDNKFLGIQGQRQLDIGLQLSSQTSNMAIDGNTFTDVKYVYWVGSHNHDANGDQFTFTNNTLTRVGDSNGVLLQNFAPADPTAIPPTSDTTITINWGTNNTIDGKTGIRGLNELSIQATGQSRPSGGATDLNAVNAVGSMPVDFVNGNWGSPARFTNPLATPDGTPGPIAYGFNTFTTVQGGVTAVDAGGTTNVLPGTYAENVTINKNVTLAGPAVSPPTAIIHPAGGVGITISAPATDVTIKNFEITGAANGITASGLTTLTLSNLNLTGNAAGGTITNVATVNDTPIIGATGATDTITGSSIQRNNDDTLTYSGVANLNVFGGDGSDTFNVTPTASTAITVDGGLPNPPVTPGDTLNLSSYAGATLTSSFNPNTGAAGQWTFNNGNQPVSFSHIETLGNVAAPAITSAASTTFTVGTGGTFSVTATGSPTPTLVETGALPGGVTFVDNGNGTATLAGTPAAGTGGVYNITVTAENGGLPPATQAFVLTVDQAPAITSANSADFAEGSSNTFSITATGFPAPTLTESGALPNGLTFVDNGNGTATLSGTPATGTHGVYTLTIVAHNGVGSDATQTFTLTVSAAVIQSSPFGYLAGMPGDGTAQTFVINLYRELLGREPDAGGETFWVGLVQQNDTASVRQAVIQSFLNSQEYKAHYVTLLYEVFLGRGPDTGGLTFWTGQMGSPGTPGGHNGISDEKFILSEIVGSDEFYAKSGGTAQGFAKALYDDLLGRPGEPLGVDAWAGIVQSLPNNRDGVVRLFLSSPEAEHKLLDSFYAAPGGTADHPLPAPGTGVTAGSYDLAVMTGDGWENLYLEGPFDSSPQANDEFFAQLASGSAWDDVQYQILTSDQFYTNGNKPVTA
jgi:hypothetical protein